MSPWVGMRHGIGGKSGGKSAAVTTASTSARAKAPRASMLTMRAWGCGLRTIKASAMNGSVRSAT